MAANAGATSQQLQRPFGWTTITKAVRVEKRLNRTKVRRRESDAQAIASVFNFTKAPTTNNTTVVSQQDGERLTKIYNIHGSGENCNLNFY